jgi:hypothetical protein
MNRTKSQDFQRAAILDKAFFAEKNALFPSIELFFHSAGQILPRVVILSKFVSQP